MNKLQPSVDWPTIKSAVPNLERPVVGTASDARFGSDVAAQTLRALDIPYIALNPGASFRGFHDSLVNFLGNQRPALMLCLHEEHAVAIAHGWAKVTGTPMAAAVHSNVGLFHATMAIFNAWCDRMPMLIIGATGPVDAAKRRPWIDWIHTARDQGAIVRPYVKWDDQPASPLATRESLLRGFFLARSAPMGPVYINLDAEMQEARLAEPLPPLDIGRYVPVIATAAPSGLVREALEMLLSAERPVILIGRVSRDLSAWNARIALAEQLGARVVTDLKVGAAFPTDHSLHAGSPGIYAVPEALEAIRAADAILSLDWVDLAGTLTAAFGNTAPAASIVQVTLDHTLHNGWSTDHQALPPVDLMLAADPSAVVEAMLNELGTEPRRRHGQETSASVEELPSLPQDGALSVEMMATSLRQALAHRETSLLHLPLSWNGAWWPFRHPLDFLGSDGGGGIGGGPGISVGAALALRDMGSGRLPVSVLGDGDFLMGVTAIWTAVHYRIPLLMVVANNRSFYNDEVHQERMARMRDRPVENKWIGQRMSDPEIDLAGIARAQGAVAFGPVWSQAELGPVLEAAIRATEAGAVVVVDVRVEPGYTPAMAASLTRTTD
jgi:acetolactate synthase-1/2/3 large subunit